MNKIIKLQNGSVFKLYNIPKIYFNKLKEEFIFEEINNIKINSYIDIEFSSGIKSDIKSLKIFKEPVCIDKYGVFFIDQQGSIARIDFQIKKSKLIKLKVNSKFDTHFFYIIMLYLASISFLKNKGIFIHASAVEQKNRLFIFPAWRNVGKTHLALQFVKNNFKLVSDDGLWLDSKGKIISCSKNIQLLYFNFKKMQSLHKYLDRKNNEIYNFLSKIKNQKTILTRKSINHLRSKIRVRLNNPHNDNTLKYRVSNNTKCIYLNRILIKEKNIKDVKKIPKERLFYQMLATTKFEFGYLFDAYNLWKMNIGLSNQYLENYDKNYLEIASRAFAKCNNTYSYNFYEQPDIAKCLN